MTPREQFDGPPETPDYVIDAENRLAEVLGDPAADQDDIMQAQRDKSDAYDDWDDDIAADDEEQNR